MPQKPKQEHIEITADMKVLLEIEQFNESNEVKSRISLGSYVEEVLPDGNILIQMPIQRGYHYPLPKGRPILMYLFAKSRMFSMNIMFLDRVEREGLMFAKVRRLSEIVSNQRRNCYRLQCTLPVMVERTADGKDEAPPPIPCRMVNFSDGGVLFTTNEDFTISEAVTMSFNIGTDETAEAEVLRFEQADISVAGTELETHRYKVAVKFLHKCKKQKDRFYRYIVEQQREIMRKQAEENILLSP